MQDVEASVIALEGFDEALRDAVAFGTADRCEEQGQAESARDVGSVLGDVGTSVVGQPVDWMWRACAFEPALDGGDHEIAYHLAGDTGVRHGRPGDDLAVAGIEHEQDPDDLAIPGVQLEMIRAPSDIRVQRDDNPSCARSGRRAVWRSSVTPWFCMIRTSRFMLTRGLPALRRWRFKRAQTRR